MWYFSHQSTLFYLFILIFFTVWWYLPVTEQNVRTVHPEGARQMDKSLCWNSNLLIAREFKRLAKKCLKRIEQKPQTSTQNQGIYCKMQLCGRGTCRSEFGRQLSTFWFFCLPWLPRAEGQQTKTEKMWFAKAKLLPACHVGSLGWKKTNKQ